MSRERSRNPVKKSPTPVRRSYGIHLTPCADTYRGDWADRPIENGSPEDELVKVSEETKTVTLGLMHTEHDE